MTDNDTRGVRGTTLVTGAHRVVRVLDADEGPFEGTLVTSGDGVAVRVDVSALGGWIGWRYSGAEHVAAPIDVIRRRGGHDVLLPWCTDQVLGFLIRRSATGAALAPGESTTLVISLLRGLDEIGDDADGTRTGGWWVTDGGRPVFVFGAGPDARTGVEEIVRRLGESSTDKMLKRALGSIGKGLEKTSTQPRIPRRLLEVWEQELLQVAAPQPLDRGPHAPERAREIARAVTSQESILPRSGQRLRADRIRTNRGIPSRVGALATAVKLSFGTAIARIALGIDGRRARVARDARVPRGRQRSRRRPFIVAGTVAAVVLAAGVLWPDGGDPGEADDAGARRASTSASGSPEPEASASPYTPQEAEVREKSEETTSTGDPRESGSSPGGDPVAAASTLLTTITTCRERDDSSCPEAVASGAGGVVDELAAAAPGTAVDLVDEYGDVAVVRLAVDESEGEAIDVGARQPTQLMVVLIRTQEKWLIRDVYDVADQP